MGRGIVGEGVAGPVKTDMSGGGDGNNEGGKGATATCGRAQAHVACLEYTFIGCSTIW